MKHVVITGSTRGIGFGLARAFLALDFAVTISGRDPGRVQAAVQKLICDFPTERILGMACDMRQPAAVKALWDGARARFNPVDF